MSQWATKRQLLYFLAVFLVFAIPFGIYAFSKYYKAPTCFDQKQNQDEEGVDCGGICTLQCSITNRDLLVVWDRSFRLDRGTYHAVAYIENQNQEAGLREILYSFKMYDETNILVKEKVGKTFVAPGERFVIFEPRIFTNERVPKTTFLEFEARPSWEKIRGYTKPDIRVEDKKITSTEPPRLEAVLVNPTLWPINDIDIAAIIYDRDDNAIAVSATYVEVLGRDSSKKIFFTWPEPFSDVPSRIEIIPRVNPFGG